MSKKVFLSPSDQWGNVYAAKGTREQVQCERIAGYAKIALERSGVAVKVALNDQPDWMAAHVGASNAWAPDLHIAVHTNALNGKTGGTQVYYGQIGEAKARTMFNAVRAAFPDSLPHTADKIDGKYAQANHWAEMLNTKALVLYVEAQFHDVPDVATYIVDHVEEIGEAIAKGACEVLGVPFVAPAKPAAGTGPLYRIQVGAFYDKALAEAYLARVKKAGFDAFIVKA